MSRRHPECLLISAVLRTGDYPSANRHGASPRLFHVHREEWEWITKQFDRTHRTPGKATFKNQFPDFSLVRTDDVLGALDLVKKDHARYTTQRFMEEAVELMNDGRQEEAVQLIAKSSADLSFQIEHSADSIDVMQNWQDTYDEVDARVERAIERGHSGIPYGFPSLDTVTGGAQPGWLTIVAARLGVGKTWSMIKMAYAAVSEGYDVLYYSLEQSRHQIAMRMQALAAHDLGYALDPGQLSHGVGLDRKLYREILEQIAGSFEGAFYVNDQTRGRVTMNSIRAGIEAKQPDLVIVDYMMLMPTKGTEWSDKAALSGEMKLCAEEYGVPITTASQINRSGVGADPGTEHLSQSDSVGQDSDIVLALTKKTDHVRRMKMIKNRHGPDGVGFPIHYDPSKGIVKEISGNEAERLTDADLDED